MAGIPPFLGFFSKLSIITLLLFYESYFLFVIFFISGLIISFYYIQNYRFFGYNLKNINHNKNNLILKFNYKYINILNISIFLNIFSLFLFNDIFIFSFIIKIN
jgi:NADH:ubiquinone oxidoreductase subunit 2 (subunit N)